jgi:Spy/CpxP family protein refolding chaperone
MTTVLSLTADQQKQATTIFTDAHAAEATVHEALKTQHDNLRAAIQKNDADSIGQASATIGTLTGQMVAIHAKAEASFYQILTADQQNKLAQFEAAGPGGPGPHEMGRPMMGEP